MPDPGSVIRTMQKDIERTKTSTFAASSSSAPEDKSALNSSTDIDDNKKDLASEPVNLDIEPKEEKPSQDLNTPEEQPEAPSIKPPSDLPVEEGSGLQTEAQEETQPKAPTISGEPSSQPEKDSQEDYKKIIQEKIQQEKVIQSKTKEQPKEDQVMGSPEESLESKNSSEEPQLIEPEEEEDSVISPGNLTDTSLEPEKTDSLTPPSPQKTKEDDDQEPVPAPPIQVDEKSNKKPIFISTAVALILLLAGGGFFYWWNYMRETEVFTQLICQDNQCIEIKTEEEKNNKCSANIDCIPDPQKPIALISANESQVISFSSTSKDLILNKLQNKVNQSQKIGTLRRILFKLENNQEKKYLNWLEFSSATSIKIPNGLNPSSNFTLFIYSQDKGKRLGLVIPIKNSTQTQNILKQWESTILTDLKELIYDSETTIEDIQLNDNTYKDVAIRYINLPDPDLSIDYAVVDGLLLITTSKESALTAIDQLK